MKTNPITALVLVFVLIFGLILLGVVVNGTTVPSQLKYEACVQSAADLGFTTGATKKRCWEGAFLK